jgi:hypothetical protein
MKLSPLRLAVRLLACVVASMAIVGTANAHEFKLDAVINAFVKIEPGEAELVVRAPLYLFKSARFPIRNAEIDADNAGPALERAIAAFQQSLTLTENGKPLAASGEMARLALPSDRSFTGYEDAQAHVAQPPERDTRIYADQGYVDARITYPIGSPHSEFAIRTTAGPELGDYLKLAVRYLPLDAETRSMVVTKRLGLVALNPPGGGRGGCAANIAHILPATTICSPITSGSSCAAGKILSVVTVLPWHIRSRCSARPSTRASGRGSRLSTRLRSPRRSSTGASRTSWASTRTTSRSPGCSASSSWLLRRPAGELPVRGDRFSFRFRLRIGIGSQILVLAFFVALASRPTLPAPGKVGMIILSAIAADTGCTGCSTVRESCGRHRGRSRPEGPPSSASGCRDLSQLAHQLPRQAFENVETAAWLRAARARD